MSLDDEPTCSGALADTSSVIFDMPLPDERCDDLFHYDDYAAGIHGWQNFFTGMDITQEGESYIISTTRRKSDGGHVSLSRSLDASCFAGLGGRTFSLFGKMRITDSGGNYVATDGTSDLSPKLTFTLDGVMSQVWRIATNSDGTWSEFSGLVTLPVDSSAAWKASIRLDKSEKNEFHIKDWGMLLVPSEAPTASPTDQPSDEVSPAMFMFAFAVPFGFANFSHAFLFPGETTALGQPNDFPNVLLLPHCHGSDCCARSSHPDELGFEWFRFCGNRVLQRKHTWQLLNDRSDCFVEYSHGNSPSFFCTGLGSQGD